MTDTGTHDLQRTDAPVQATNESSQTPDQASAIAQLQAELASIKAMLEERERALLTEQRRAQALQEQLATRDSAAPKTAAANPFDMVLTLSSEREAALRERKLYKDRAVDAEANVAQLESDLAAAHATAKLQAERANKLATRSDELQRRIAELEAQLSTGHDTVNAGDAATTLRRLLQERDNRILELEMQLTDRAGTPTLFGGELERHAAGTVPTVIYALESLDTPGDLHRLTLPVNTVGRSKSNDIPLDSSSVSRFHARLLNKPDGVWLVDLQSSNGCQVNGRRTSSQVLREGDLVLIGHCRFRFSAATQHPSASMPSCDQAAPSP